MGLGQRLRALIDRPAPPDPDEWVCVGMVPSYEGPLCTSALEGAGIEAQALDSFGGGRLPGRTTVMVRARDAAAAEAIVRDVHTPGANRPESWIRRRNV